MVDFEPLDPIPPDDELQQKFWTRGRIIYAIIALLIIIAFLTYILWPTIIAITQSQQPTPVPTTPLPRVSLSSA